MERFRLLRLLPAAGLLLSTLTSCADFSPDDDYKMVIAVTATMAEPAPALSQSLRQRLMQLGKASEAIGDAKVAVIVQVAADQPRKPWYTIDLTPVRGERIENDTVLKTTKIDDKINDLSDKLARASSTAAGLDMRRLLGQAAQVSSKAPIVLISSGVSTIDPLDMRSLAWSVPVPTVIEDLKKKHLVPNKLKGRTVLFVGLGEAYPPQPALDIPQQEYVTDLALEMCQAAKAHCSTLDDAPVPGKPKAAISVPTVPVPKVGTLKVNNCTTRVRLPATLLFKPFSAHLEAYADPQLSKIRNQVLKGEETAPGTVKIAYIDGHTADTGTTGDGTQLSKDRAQAVATRLLQLGVPKDNIGKVRGFGHRHPIKKNFNPDGSFNEAIAANNRRVEITIKDNCPK